ncbi:hypothetical protein OG905_00345 [Streptomyces sp. NBC_00322]|uniref:hypothetical protein n=1 Tax=Streptomyces sp. NBC_00322 TaxID=2975712 RepID=UPI002E2CB587|nr:hypothetical protein [Streptomyces sp. NBC_00322]
MTAIGLGPRRRDRRARALPSEAEAAPVVAVRKKKRLPRFRFALRHPIRTLRRNQGKAIDRTGFGLGQYAGIGTFVVVVLGWLTLQYLSHYP